MVQLKLQDTRRDKPIFFKSILLKMKFFYNNYLKTLKNHL